MTKKAIYQQIRNTVDAHLPGTRILLFGSRARGDAGNGSDFDLLIITPGTLTSHEKMNWATLLDKALVFSLKAPFDILINSEEEVRQKQDLPGHIIRSVVSEGVAI